MRSRALTRSPRKPWASGELICRFAAVYFVAVNADQARASCWEARSRSWLSEDIFFSCFWAATHACQPGQENGL